MSRPKSTTQRAPSYYTCLSRIENGTLVCLAYLENFSYNWHGIEVYFVKQITGPYKIFWK